MNSSPAQADHRAGPHARPQAIGCTLTPFEGAYYAKENGEASARRSTRGSGPAGPTMPWSISMPHARPRQPQALSPTYDPGDHLHPTTRAIRPWRTPWIFPSSVASGPRPSRPSGERANRRRARLRALAKINLDLRVLGKRPDGFHELRHHLSDHFAGGYHRHSLHARPEDLDRGGRRPRHSR